MAAAKIIVPFGEVILASERPIAILRSPHQLLEYYEVVVVEPAAEGQPAMIYVKRDDVQLMLGETPGFEHRGIVCGHYVLAVSGDQESILKTILAVLAAEAPVAT